MTTRNPKGSPTALVHTVSIRVTNRAYDELTSHKPPQQTMGEFVRDLVIAGLVERVRKERSTTGGLTVC